MRHLLKISALIILPVGLVISLFILIPLLRERRGVCPPDCRGIEFQQRDLRQMALAGANLREATLTGANLEGVNLERADGYFAQFEGANLKQAHLGHANQIGRASCRERV